MYLWSGLGVALSRVEPLLGRQEHNFFVVA